jgi:hypothetical protein
MKICSPMHYYCMLFRCVNKIMKSNNPAHNFRVLHLPESLHCCPDGTAIATDARIKKVDNNAEATTASVSSNCYAPRGAFRSMHKKQPRSDLHNLSASALLSTCLMRASVAIAVPSPPRSLVSCSSIPALSVGAPQVLCTESQFASIYVI